MTPSRLEAQALLTAPGAEFEIVDEVVMGHPMRVFRHTPNTLRDVLAASRRHGERDAVVFEGERYSFETHYRRVAAVARALAGGFGVRKGDRVAIAMRNYPEFCFAFWATTVLGAIAVPLNAWWKGEELSYGIRDSGSRLVIVDKERLERLKPRLATLPTEAVLVARSGDEKLPPEAIALDDVIEAAGEGDELPLAEIDTDDDATIFYTSGTTGHPKGALGTHRNICSELESIRYLVRLAEVRSGVEVAEPKPQLAALLSVPLFHATGCHATMVPTLEAGNKLVLSYRFDAEDTVRLIESERITSFGGVPAVAWQVLEAPNRRDHDLSSVQRIGYGGAPAPPELVRQLSEAFPGVALSNGYGLTETSAGIVRNSGEDYLRKPESIGPPLPVCDFEIMDPEGRPLPVGEVGEIWVRGPHVIKGYWNKPEATAETITDGWLHTGDLARLDDEGFVVIVDRAKDMVIRGGENVYCVEVEAAIFEHPAVMEAAVFGRPHRILGEEVVAVVRLKPDAEATEGELRAHTAERLAEFKVPVTIDLRRDDFPRNANGKILKGDLRAQMLGMADVEGPPS